MGTLQFFVDNIQELRLRSDSTMLLLRARELRVELLKSGYLECDVPKLDLHAGWNWICRWRKQYGIARKALGLKLEVS